MKYIFFLLISCVFLTLAGASRGEETQRPENPRQNTARPLAEELKKLLPGFARAAAWIDGEKLLAQPDNFELFKGSIPGLNEEQFSREDLAHSYLFFASEDLKVYGAVIGKGKGSLAKLHALFRRTPQVVKLIFTPPSTLLVIWGNETTPALKLKKDAAFLKTLDPRALISSTGIMQLSKLPGNAPKKLLKEFPELKHLLQVRLTVQNNDRQTLIRFIFDNEKSPHKGFSFLNWGLALILWHKTGVFRRIRQDVEKNQLCLTLFDPPFGKIAQKLIPAAQTKKKTPASVLPQMKRLLLALELYAADHGNRFPVTLSQLQGIYLPSASFLTVPVAKAPFLYHPPDGSSFPVLRENPLQCSPSKKRLTVIFSNGKIEKRPSADPVFSAVSPKKIK